MHVNQPLVNFDRGEVPQRESKLLETTTPFPFPPLPTPFPPPSPPPPFPPTPTTPPPLTSGPSGREEVPQQPISSPGGHLGGAPRRRLAARVASSRSLVAPKGKMVLERSMDCEMCVSCRLLVNDLCAVCLAVSCLCLVILHKAAHTRTTSTGHVGLSLWSSCARFCTYY